MFQTNVVHKIKTHILCSVSKVGKVHPCTDTEALYRPYDP